MFENTEYPNFMVWIIRRKNKLSQFELSEAIKKSEALISLWCNGKNIPRLDTLVLLCNLFADDTITAEELLTEAVQKIRLDIMLKNGVYDDYIKGDQ
jgi:transcriptional regulator with XRE-family HTH domain